MYRFICIDMALRVNCEEVDLMPKQADNARACRDPVSVLLCKQVDNITPVS